MPTPPSLTNSADEDTLNAEQDDDRDPLPHSFGILDRSFFSPADSGCALTYAQDSQATEHPLPRLPRALPTTLRSRLLLALIALLVLLCVYASFADDFMGDVESAVSCGTCIALLAPLKALANVGDDAFVETFVGFCSKLGIEDPDVCLGAVGSQAPILAHDLRSIALASPAAKSFCSTVFGLCPLQKTREHRVALQEARVEVEAREFEGLRVQGEQGRVRRKWGESGRREPFKVVHISDVHVDRDYVEGASTDCSKVICCRAYGPHSTGEGVKSPAGKYGHKKCDAPPALVESMLEAVEHYAPDRAFTIFTGDVVESAVWAVDEPGVTSDLHLWNQDLRFQNLSATSSSFEADQAELVVGRRSPSYPVIGNHDIAPVNAFPRSPQSSPPYSGTSAQWVYDLSSRDWRRWIGRRAAEQVRTRSGCYARVHPGTRLKVVSVNTNLWYKQNFWLYDNNIPHWDPNGILTWLAEELDDAEREGLRVWIIGHMPFGKVDAMRDQSNYANQIFDRYSSTIAAHFYGHSHVDEFEISYTDYRNRTVDRADGIAFIGGAVTPTSGNPVFRVYDVDPDTYEIMDFTPVYANKTSPTYQLSPNWQPYYSARQSYNSFLDPPVPDAHPLNATFWHRVTEVFEKNETVFQLFNTRLSRGGKIEDCSGPICRKNTICMLRSMRSEDNCAVIQPGLSFKDQKRDTDAVTEPQRDEEADFYALRQPPSPSSNSSLHAPDWPEERFAQSRQHDFFACEGPGLGSMLRKLGSGIALPRRAVEGEVGVLGGEEGRGEADFSALRAFQQHVHAQAAKHARSRLKRWTDTILRV
ncbi:hypothetical protein JCM10213v2_008331 [Rhodosporidiobolus nylandii]